MLAVQSERLAQHIVAAEVLSGETARQHDAIGPRQRCRGVSGDGREWHNPEERRIHFESLLLRFERSATQVNVAPSAGSRDGLDAPCVELDIPRRATVGGLGMEA